jgi:hypothetical protein
MKDAQKLEIACLAGPILGVINAKYLFVGSGLSLIPWSLAGLAFGAWSSSWKQALVMGSSYGFSLAYVFMIASYDGPDLVGHLLPLAGLGLVGAACGLVLALAGYGLTRLIRR